MALVNQQMAANKQPRLGFVNPLIYAIGAGASYESDLHDITTGNNSGYSAHVGYDLATGWGSPSGQPLINSLAGARAHGIQPVLRPPPRSRYPLDKRP